MELPARSPDFLLFVLFAVAAEFLWRRLANERYDVGGAAASFGVAAGNIASAGLGALIIAPVYALLYGIAPIKLPLDDWRVWVAGFFAVEFAYYWMHRWSHFIRWMWATHAVHHSAEEFTLPAAIRLGWTSALSGAWVVFTPLILLGFHPLLVVTLLAVNLKYQFLLHTEKVGRLGPLEWILNTPSHHRVHHASNPLYLDRNFGGVLIVFDRPFGTFAAEDAREPLIFGLTKPLKSRNPFVIALHEWGFMIRDAAAARSPTEFGAALFGRPGAAERSRRERLATTLTPVKG